MSLQLKLEELYGPTEGGRDEDEVEITGAHKEKDNLVEEARSSEQGVKGEGDAENEGDEDDDDPKPRSFGKVAMEEGSAGNPLFPTVFASISLISQVNSLSSLIIGRILDPCS